MTSVKFRLCKRWTKEQWEDFITLHSQELSESFKASLNNLLEKWKLERTDPLCFIRINFLRTAIIPQTPFFLITGTGEKNYLDFQPSEVFWEAGLLSKQLYENIPMPNLRYPKHTDPKEYEIEELWMEEAEKMFKAMENTFYLLLEKIECNQSSIFYGEYLDRQTQLTNRKKDG